MGDPACRFHVGDRVTDPHHGFATVTFVGVEYVGLRFEAGGRDALFKMDGHRLRPGWDEAVLVEESPEEDAASLPWPDSTFIAEGEEASHFMGSHWVSFHDDGPRPWLERLPGVIQELSPLGGFGDVYRPAREVPEDWPAGAHLVRPQQHHRLGLVVTLRFEEQETQIVSLYPYVDLGVQTTIRMTRVRVWESGVEAQIDATWGEASVTFFDTCFLLNRGWYEAGCSYEFLLAGIAYAAGPAKETRIPFTPHPDVIAWRRMLAEQRGDAPPERPEWIDLTGTAFFLSIPEWDRDDYSFRGPVRSVEPFTDFLGQDGWKVTVTVMRFGEEDADLDIFITQRVWQGAAPPQVGQDIEGRLWLQGRLWSAPQAWQPGARRA